MNEGANDVSSNDTANTIFCNVFMLIQFVDGNEQLQKGRCQLLLLSCSNYLLIQRFIYKCQ